MEQQPCNCQAVFAIVGYFVSSRCKTLSGGLGREPAPLESSMTGRQAVTREAMRQALWPPLVCPRHDCHCLSTDHAALCMSCQAARQP